MKKVKTYPLTDAPRIPKVVKRPLPPLKKEKE